MRLSAFVVFLVSSAIVARCAPAFDSQDEKVQGGFSSRRSLVKCCRDLNATSNNVRCVLSQPDWQTTTTRPTAQVNDTTLLLLLFDDFQNAIASDSTPSAFSSSSSLQFHLTDASNNFTVMEVTEATCFHECLDVWPNGTINIVKSFRAVGDRAIDERNGAENGSICQLPERRGENEVVRCDSIFTPLSFWGANIVIFANVIYIVPYVILIFVYSFVPGLRKRAYDRAVLCYNLCQIALNAVMIGIGFLTLCHVKETPWFYGPACLILMFLTISSTSWLFVICIDMTLVITSFRWIPPSDVSSQRQERRKFLIYSAWVFGSSFILTTFACIVEYSPFVPKSSPIRPNFQHFSDGPNVAVIAYVVTLPLITCLLNTALFVYTTFKLIRMRRSTSIATKNSSRAVKANECYTFFLKLYFLMDSPWITSALGAIYTELWIFKFFRMVQPMFMLLAILPRGTLGKLFYCCKPNEIVHSDVDASSDPRSRRCFRCCGK